MKGTIPSGYLKVSVLFIVVFSAFFVRIPSVPFHMDEALALTKSRVLEVAARGDLENAVWGNFEFAEKVVRGYIIGISRYLGGYSEEDLNKSWDRRLSHKQNAEAGNMPSARLLWWGRLPSVLFSTLAILLICWFVGRMSGGAGILACILLLMGNKYFMDTMGRAREEAPLMGVTLVIFYSVYRGTSSLMSSGRLSGRSVGWLVAASLLSGLAGGLKLNGAILSLLGPLAVALFFIMDSPRSMDVLKVVYWTCLSAALMSVSFATFVVVNPSLYRSPVKSSEVLYEHRSETMEGQLDRFPEDDMRDLSNLRRIKTIAYRTFGNYAAINFRGSVYTYICFFLYGVALTTLRAFRRDNSQAVHAAAASRVFLLGSLLTSAVIVVLLKLDWDRFYCIPVIFSTVFVAIGLAGLYKVAASAVRTGFKLST